MMFCFCLLQELLEYLDGLIKEYDKYVDEDGNLREDVADKQSAERAVEEIQLCYNSFVNTNPILRELSQRGKDNPPGSQVCISPVKSQSGDDFVIVDGEENTDSIITDTITIDNITAYNTHQTELNEPIANDKDKYNNIGEDIDAQEDESVKERNSFGNSTISSSAPVSTKNGTITNKLTNYNGENQMFNNNQSEHNAPIADGGGYYKNNDRSIPDEEEAPMDRSIKVNSCELSPLENDNRMNMARKSDKDKSPCKLPILSVLFPQARQKSYINARYVIETSSIPVGLFITSVCTQERSHTSAKCADNLLHGLAL